MQREHTRFLKRKEVRQRAGNIVDSTLYHWINQGIFPRPVQLGPQRVGWREADVDEWAANPTAWREAHLGVDKEVVNKVTKRLTIVTEHNCGSCRHFHNATHTWCLRYPPVPVDNRHSIYPVVVYDQWCGEWHKRDRTSNGY